MKLEIDLPGKDLYRIESYTTGMICINGEHLKSSLIVSPRLLIDSWPPKSFTDIAPQHMDQVIQLNPDIIILGTGRQLYFPPAHISEQIRLLGIGFEVMDTGAACRCYNLLMGEGRNVAAALIMPGA
jgi:uncharacterized protein